MWKEKVLSARDFIVRNSKFVFPFIVIAVVAITVCAALKAGNAKGELPEEESTVAVESSEQVAEPVNTEVPLVKNEDAAIAALIETYYNAMAEGDEETLRGICDEITDKDMLRYVETAKYTKAYTTLEVYTKPGLESGTTIAYVYYKAVFEGYEDEFPGYQAHYICTNDQGELYFKRGENKEEVNEYVKRVSSQNDVVEFNNRINVEYNELIEQKPELLVYLQQLDSQVSTAVGEGLANLAQQAESEQQTEGTENTQQGTGESQTEGSTGNVTQFATATTTVNVRSSDSEQADKLGKVAGGEKIQVLEQRLNGWSKVLYESKEGFIKSEYLQVGESTESAEGVASSGKVTATTNINVRAKASETAEKIGTLLGGDSAELISTENGWCKIKFNGQIAYVKAEYVQ
ncbi:MAG: SH3 domain-containing protein [Lachnospiraceae bacterium]|nr:SH3 domain-containing protein [Lachnospiraceae bacterium]